MLAARCCFCPCLFRTRTGAGQFSPVSKKISRAQIEARMLPLRSSEGRANMAVYLRPQNRYTPEKMVGGINLGISYRRGAFVLGINLGIGS